MVVVWWLYGGGGCYLLITHAPLDVCKVSFVRELCHLMDEMMSGEWMKGWVENG